MEASQSEPFSLAPTDKLAIVNQLWEAHASLANAQLEADHKTLPDSWLQWSGFSTEVRDELHRVTGSTLSSAAYRLLDGFPRSEMTRLAMALWEDMIDEVEQIPIPDWHIEELERREEEFARNPEAEICVEDAFQFIRARRKHNRPT